MSAAPLITAIVSTYAAERYMRGCLEDLLAQTIADRIEILVIDACSPQNEGAIVREFQGRHPQIRYLRNAEREYSSRTFNRATAMARGKYLTTANTDDRHRADFFARMVAVLDEHPECGIAYADSLITRRDNETFTSNSASTRQAWPDYTHTTALSCCLFGAQPVWRRAVQQMVGAWDETLFRANDQDMFLRIALHSGAVHVAESLGMFLARADSVAGADNRGEALTEVLGVFRRYRTSTPLEVLFPGLRTDNSAHAEAAALVEMGNLCALGPYTDARLALEFWQRAMALPLPLPAGCCMRQVFANNSACVLAAAGERDRACRALKLAGELPCAQVNAQRVSRPGAPPQLLELQFAELAHAVVDQSRESRALVIGAGGTFEFTPSHTQLPWHVYAGPNGVPIEDRHGVFAATGRQ